MNWLKYKSLYFFISLSLIFISIFSIIKYGFNPSIEFTGGSVTTSQGYEYIGPTIGQETIKKTYTSIILATLAILTYISFTFKNLKYGVCAILAMLHDTLILLGSLSLFGHFLGLQTDLLSVTAVLMTLSFSVHDTIVVFDRIRELNKNSQTDNQTSINQAITDTIVRSLNNSLTIIFMLLALFLMGASSIKNFILALLIGTIVGTYSSTFTASPLLVIWSKLFDSRK